MAIAAALTLALVGCSPGAGEIGREDQEQGRSAAPTSVVTEVRRTNLAVSSGMRLQIAEFADATHGYASFVTGDPVEGTGENGLYASNLFATVDGGRTWTQLVDPRPPSLSPQLYTVDPSTIVLLAEPYGWYVSTDGGAKFSLRQLYPAPPELEAAWSPYRIDCETGCVLKRSDGTKDVTMPQPSLPGDLQSVVAASGDLWTASLDERSVPHTAVSRDGGQTWRRRDVPAHPGGQPARMDFRVSADGTDLWLVGYLGGSLPGNQSRVPVAGPPDAGVLSLPLRRKDVGVPLLWLLQADRWVPKGTVDAPTPSLVPFAVAAIGGGLAAVTGPHGLALVSAEWHMMEMNPRPEWVGTLRDGTIVAPAPTGDTWYLGRRTGLDVSWTQLVIGSAT